MQRPDAAAAPHGLFEPVKHEVADVDTRREEQPLPICENCGGDGWYLDHDDKCYEDGDCSCSGVQVECDVCA